VDKKTLAVFGLPRMLNDALQHLSSPEFEVVKVEHPRATATPKENSGFDALLVQASDASEAALVAHWLSEHPGSAVICLDTQADKGKLYHLQLIVQDVESFDSTNLPTLLQGLSRWYANDDLLD